MLAGSADEDTFRLRNDVTVEEARTESVAIGSERDVSGAGQERARKPLAASCVLLQQLGVLSPCVCLL